MLPRIRSLSPEHSAVKTPQRPSSARQTQSAPAHWSPRVNLRGHLGGSVADAEALIPLHERTARRLFVTPPRLQALVPEEPHG